MNPAALIQNKWVRRATVVVLVVLAFWLIAWIAVPPILKNRLEAIASEKLGRRVLVGPIEFKPWTLELTLNDLRVASPDGRESQLQIGRIYADVELQSLLRLAPVIDAVTIDAPVVKLTRLAGGKYDIDDIVAKLASAPATPASEPQKFAIHNIVISGGAVDFNDEQVRHVHQLRDLVLHVPFLSNLASQRDVTTEPRLAFVLNGSKFDSAAFTTPFSDNRKTDARFEFKGLDLAPYRGYVPAGLPVQLQAATLDADLKVAFERGATPGLRISGVIEAHGARLVDAKGGDLLAFESLKLDLADLRPLEQFVHLSAISLVAPRISVMRNAAGQLNLLPAASVTGAAATPDVPAAVAVTGAAGKTGWRTQVDMIALQGGALSWRDQTLQPAAAVAASGLGIEVRAVTWPMDKPATFDGHLTVQGAAVRFKGAGTDQSANVQADVDALPLSLAAPYLAQSLEPTLDGRLSGEVGIDWQKTGPTAGLRFKAARVLVADLALATGKTSLASVGKVEVTGADVDMTRRTLAIGTFTATQPRVQVERDAEKRWMYERWLKVPAQEEAKKETEPVTRSAGSVVKPVAAASAVAPATPAVTVAGGAAAAGPWQLTIARLAVNGGAVSYADRASDTPVVFDLTALNVQAEKVAPGSVVDMPLQVSGRIGAGRRADPGRFDFNGTLALQPLSAQGRLDVSAIPAHAFKTYYQDVFNNVDVRRAFLGYKGTVRYAATPGGPALKLVGDISLEDFRASSSTLTQARGIDSSNELLSWKALGLRGLQLTLAPGAAPVVDVSETTLTDFFARVIVDEAGRVNLQNLTRPAGSAAATSAEPPRSAAELAATPTPNATASIEVQPATDSAPPLSVRAGNAPVSVSTQRMAGGGTSTTRTPLPTEPIGSRAAAISGARSASAPAAVAPASGKPVIRFGPMSLVNGRVDFTDNFVKPNYSADLTALTGRLSAFSSTLVDGASGMADLELRGKAQQTAALDIVGKINPLVKPLVLDITAKMSGLDLPPLSPYSVRYAGHGIERGKLSMEVRYQVTPDGQLTASNKLVLNQLRFGDEVQGAPNSLPVRLAVALLADRNGVIDVDFPISGSLNDPQFSIGPLIFKAIINLIAKAAVAPFALLTGGFGGDNGESSVIAFDAGSSTLSAVARENLDKVAKALVDRPGLRMTVVGTANLEKERDAYQRQHLRELAQSEKRRIATRAGEDPVDVTPITDAEYPALLAAVYKRADLAKPRNMIGLTRDLPVVDMENLLLTSIPVDDNAIRELAVERGVAVRDHLLTLKVPADRLFLGAVRTRTGDAKWQPGAELNLATN